ncbi:hypothetical protein TESG_08640 [Trichophyton tonsurans CBS 112818]|uniref:Uncharacterized protein n=1 Tax=Trichophyton tonsurans (strain CBS 112818) TaxID=647933 RepID=F2S9J2_TRIT1|nr:hypothetical protein TESG_08640 [Trichophyton tonsurans CBS 112818]
MTSVTWETITVPIKSNARPRRLLQAKRKIQGFAAEGRFAGEDGALLLREPCHGRVAARQGRSASRPPTGPDVRKPSGRRCIAWASRVGVPQPGLARISG